MVSQRRKNTSKKCDHMSRYVTQQRRAAQLCRHSHRPYRSHDRSHRIAANGRNRSCMGVQVQNCRPMQSACLPPGSNQKVVEDCAQDLEGTIPATFIDYSPTQAARGHHGEAGDDEGVRRAGAGERKPPLQPWDHRSICSRQEARGAQTPSSHTRCAA